MSQHRRMTKSSHRTPRGGLNVEGGGGGGGGGVYRGKRENERWKCCTDLTLELSLVARDGQEHRGMRQTM